LNAVNLLILSVIISCIFYILYVFIIYFNYFYLTFIFKFASLNLDLSNFEHLFAGFAILAKINGVGVKRQLLFATWNCTLHLSMGYMECIPIFTASIKIIIYVIVRECSGRHSSRCLEAFCSSAVSGWWSIATWANGRHGRHGREILMRVYRF